MNRVVVTGMGAVTPIGTGVPAYWDALQRGVCGIDVISSFDVLASKCTLAAEVKDFDAAARLDKTTARKTDRYTQFALAAADEAMQDSGLVCGENISAEAIGVYVGSGIGGFGTLCAEHEAMLDGGSRKVSSLFIPKMISNIAAGNIAIRFGAMGPNMAHATACATASTAIGEAYRAILHGYADAMICGGAEASINPLAVAGFGNMSALSPATDRDAASLPFDVRRGGFVMGEGAGILVLEAYEHAAARGAKIYAEIVGYGATCDAHHITAPDPEGTQVARAIIQSLPEEVPAPQTIYLNAHGTGTPLNDKTETLAIKRAFGADAAKIHISSTKSMTGHMLGAAGGAEAIAAILALVHDCIPPTIHLETPDPECDLDYTPMRACHTAVNLALSTSLGFGGHNACLAFRKVVD
ncbi:MAG: beta-ketoacyl-[acyl-carrier-protein] synthase II [Ruminococcaceae bacterium]|nr:beta-ketoacyl-[acyl-carrier-protein] synthase II [Oscillospiraceae bacterium]